MKIFEVMKYLNLDFTGENIELNKLEFDSRKVEKGDLFVALSGTKADGHLFLNAAIERGAGAILIEKAELATDFSVPTLVVPDTRIALTNLAAMWYDFPDKSMRTIGITGTNGKTTTSNLIKKLLETKGQKVGLLGTIQNMVGEEILPASHTTPEPVALFNLIAKMRDAACDSLVMEVSSHSLKQHRVDGCNYDVAIFTNLTQDHLDFHLTLEDYKNSKIRLFAMLEENDKSYGVVNIDDAVAQDFIQACKAKIITYGVDNPADLRAKNLEISRMGTTFDLEYQGKTYPVNIPLSGKFNVYNSLAAMAVAMGEGMAIEEVIEKLMSAPQVAGRFEKVDEGQDFAVIVDYAHTPDGLLNVLSTARGITTNRLITVFGCGGDRDRTKRPIMGEISGKYSDFSVVTSDNPRTEEPMFIISQVEEGIKNVTSEYVVEANRGEAIAVAIKMARSGDVVVIAGKGHEDYQLVQGQVLHFDDREEARKILKSLK